LDLLADDVRDGRLVADEGDVLVPDPARHDSSLGRTADDSAWQSSR
jgi:hypothetical protein